MSAPKRRLFASHPKTIGALITVTTVPTAISPCPSRKANQGRGLRGMRIGRPIARRGQAAMAAQGASSCAFASPSVACAGTNSSAVDGARPFTVNEDNSLLTKKLLSRRTLTREQHQATDARAASLFETKRTVAPFFASPRSDRRMGETL